MNDTALLRRLKALDSGADPAAACSDAAVDAEIARITALPTDRAPCRRVSLRRVGWRGAAGALAFGAIGVGAAYAAGIPQDVIRVFTDQHTPAGLPGPWGAHNVTLAASLPLEGGGKIQVWTADNQLNGTCSYFRLVDVGTSVRDLGNGCEGSSTSPSVPGGAAPQLSHQSVEVQRLSYQTDEGPATVLIGQVFDPAVSRGAVEVPDEKAVPLTFSADKHWAVVRLPVGVNPGVTGSTLRLYTPGGSVASTVDLVDYSASPEVFYNADGSVAR